MTTQRSFAWWCRHAVMMTVVLCTPLFAFGQQPFTEGTQVMVTATALRLRAAPSLSANNVGTYPRGSVATIVDPSPYWADGYWWWQIAYPDGARGWSAEGDAQEQYVEELPPRAGPGQVEQPQAVRSLGVPVEARALFESLFWNGSLVLSCAEQPQFLEFESFSELRLERSCTSPMLSGTYTSDLGSMASVAEGEWLLTVDVVDVVDTHLGRLYLVEYVDDIAYGVAGAVMYNLYLDAGSGPELVLRVASWEYALRLISAGPVVLLQNWSGSAALELASDRFVRRHGLVEAAPARFPSESESQAHFTRLRRTAHERGALAARALAPQELAAAGISSSTIAQLDDVIDALQAIAAEPYLSDAVRAERLRVVQRSWDAELVAIAVRLVPVYDPSSGDIQSFDAFARELTRDLGTGSPFAADPVGATVDLLFNPSVENVSRLLGLGH